MKKSTKSANSPTNLAKVRDFMQKNPIGTISTIGRNRKPHGAIVYYGLDDNFSVTFVTKNKTVKHKNIQKRSDVMLVVFEPKTQTMLQLIGKATDVTDTADAQAIFVHTLKVAGATSSSGIPPVSKLQAGHYVTYRITPEEIRLAEFGQTDPISPDAYMTLHF